MIAAKISSGKTGDERLMVARVWAEVIAPTFNYPTHWILNELVGFSQESKSFSIVKCKCSRPRLHVNDKPRRRC